MTGARAPGPLIASGRWSDVYALDARRVLRRYRDPAGRPWWEPDVMRLARAGGVPVPEVFDVDGPDLVLERVDGPTMLSDLGRRPWRARAHARTLVELHRLVHAVPGPSWLRSLSDDDGRLLHLDLHPANVILSDVGPVLIDWQGAARGTAATDLAHTYLLLVSSTIPGGLRQRVIGRTGQSAFAGLYRTAAGPAAVDGELIAVARRRLIDPTLRPEEAARIRLLLSRAERFDPPPIDRDISSAADNALSGGGRNDVLAVGAGG